MLWDKKKTLLLSPALQIWKGARKYEPSVRKRKPSVTWVSKKSDRAAPRDADGHIHLTWAVNSETPRGFLAWTAVSQQRAEGGRPPLSLGWAWRGVTLEGRGRGVGQSWALSLGKEPACCPEKQWAGVKPWPVAFAKLLVWALTFYTASLPTFINLHFVCGTASSQKKKGLGEVDAWHSAVSHMKRLDFSVWKRVLTENNSVCFSKCLNNLKISGQMKILPNAFIRNTSHLSRKIYYIVFWSKLPYQPSKFFWFWPEYPVPAAITPLLALLCPCPTPHSQVLSDHPEKKLLNFSIIHLLEKKYDYTVVPHNDRAVC